MNVSINRKCDGCTECCKGWLFGEAYGKKFHAGKPCHFVGEKGCTIYKNRPHNPCITFRCEWLNNPEMFPEWTKPNLSKILATKLLTKNKIPYIKIHECGEKIDSTVLNYFILYALNNSVNIAIQVNGGWANYGNKDFLNDLNDNN